MSNTLPTETEILAIANELGVLDASGRYPREKRARLAKVAIAMREAPAADDPGPDLPTTAAALSRFFDELRGEDFGASLCAELVQAVAPVLVREHGLRLNPITDKENPTP